MPQVTDLEKDNSRLASELAALRAQAQQLREEVASRFGLPQVS
jgi:hypothetical protein